MYKLETLAIAVLSSCVVVTGCSKVPLRDGEAVPGGADRTEPGIKIEGSGYTYLVPEGWRRPKQLPNVDSGAFDGQDTDQFPDNVNVAVSRGEPITPAALEAGAVEQYRAAGATDVSVEDRVLVAGREAMHIRATATRDGNNAVSEQFYVPGEAALYIVSFSFSPSVPSEERDRIARFTLSTWTWTR